MKIVSFIAIVLLPFGLWAQSFETGLMIGASAYQGDISPKATNISTGKMHPSLGVFFRCNMNKFFTAKANVSYGKISGADADAMDESRRQRNLSFQSDIYEFGLTGEINLFGFEPGGDINRISPYLFGGIAVFHFNPETNFNGEWVELQPLGTEGQGMEGFEERYKLTQIAIPLGGGIKWSVSERINIGAEIGFRKTFTDYLDDVSGTYVAYSELLNENGELSAILSDRRGELVTNGDDSPIDVVTGTQVRGNPGQSDWYLMSGITVSYTLYPNYTFGGRGGYGCPKF